MNTTIWEQFRAIRKRNKISQETLSKKTGVHRSTIVRLESGDGGVKASTLLRLLDGIGAKLEIL
jgi:transcriptional regulator with XRE-family HTH domain